MITYSIWQDYTNRFYEVVRWINHKEVEIVATNILTREKAGQTLADWQQREKDKGNV